MKIALLSAILVVGAGVALADSPPAGKAAALADATLEGMGGAKAWNETRFLRFDFAVERGGKTVVSRAHTWDKWTGRYRLEAKTKAGDPYVVLMNVATKEGVAYLKGARLNGPEEKQYVEQAYGTWVNDTYWLIMPYKLKDPGVNLADAGELKTKDGEWDKMLLTFDGVGLTPKDKYWVYVNRKTNLVDRWDFVLNGEKGPASTFEWTEWKKHGSIMLAAERRNPKDGTRIYFPVLDAPQTVSDATFTTP